jgi:hypothetical protein
MLCDFFMVLAAPGGHGRPWPTLTVADERLIPTQLALFGYHILLAPLPMVRMGGHVSVTRAVATRAYPPPGRPVWRDGRPLA